MALTSEQVERVAKLARLSLSNDEIEGFRDQLSTIVDYIGKLQSLDVSGVEPTVHAVDVESTPLREDVVGESLTPGEALANAPAKAGTLFLVPRIIE
ncbi:Asp-tRNA(Asn)/Glu-tRNA(Gln) amidotransferase subunit GatC [Vulgatibacter incomptus]|nr:Asp-tRNA(Asn)/Glu-tRNA(Gln) amidotransferase subunit GatC [Vulgatibacter incomptus]